jgi:hypothetical protein
MGKRLTVLTILLLSFVLVAGCDNPLVVGDSLNDFYSPDGTRPNLQNNPAAVDVSYDELVAFLDQVTYTKGYCLKLAVALHDLAEAHGIRAGVLIFKAEEDYHAVTEFQTTDQGRVFVDPNVDKEIKSWQEVRQHYNFAGGYYGFW